jgi:hypothetical protein
MCKHKKFIVDESSKNEATEETIAGTTLRLFMGGAMDGIQYSKYYTAIATCKKCSVKFYVRASKSKKWENQRQVDYVSSKWNPVMKSVEKVIEIEDKKYIPFDE